MDAQDQEQIFRSALNACRGRRYSEATKKLRLLIASGSNDPRHISFYGLTLAHDRRTLRDGIEHCQRAVRLRPDDPQMYLNLARVYSSTGGRLRAVQVLRQGIRATKSSGLLRELERLSPRGRPVINALGRDHLLNKYLGRFRSRLGRTG